MSPQPRDEMRDALVRLEQWDMLSLASDGHGAVTADAPYFRQLIADALAAGLGDSPPTVLSVVCAVCGGPSGVERVAEAGVERLPMAHVAVGRDSPRPDNEETLRLTRDEARYLCNVDGRLYGVQMNPVRRNAALMSKLDSFAKSAAVSPSPPTGDAQ